MLLCLLTSAILKIVAPVSAADATNPARRLRPKSLLHHVVLLNRSMASWAEEHGVDPHKASSMLLVILEELVTFFHDDLQRGALADINGKRF